MANDQIFEKCKMCGIPLNSEIKSQSDPLLCFECAEETRKFTVNECDSPLCKKCGVELNDFNSDKDCPDLCKKCNTQAIPPAEGKSSKGGWFSRLFKK